VEGGDYFHFFKTALEILKKIKLAMHVSAMKEKSPE
jgi:hypothetical protein